MKSLCCALFALLLLPGGCDRYPRDTEATLDRVRGGTIRVATVEGERPNPRMSEFLARLAARTGSRPQLASGAAEPLLLELERGDLDLVVGTFDRKSPWAHRVTFSRPIARVVRADAVEELKAATRNGEHAWAIEVDRTVAAMAGVPT
jgi:hypothetical protein